MYSMTKCSYITCKIIRTDFINIRKKIIEITIEHYLCHAFLSVPISTEN